MGQIIPFIAIAITLLGGGIAYVLLGKVDKNKGKSKIKSKGKSKGKGQSQTQGKGINSSDDPSEQTASDFVNVKDIRDSFLYTRDDQ